MKFLSKNLKKTLQQVRELLDKKGLTPEEYDRLSRIELEITINLETPDITEIEWVDSLYRSYIS